MTIGTDLNPRTTTYEFLGSFGALAISVGVPIVTYLLYFGCSEAAGGCPPPLTSISGHVAEAITNPSWWKGLWDTEAALIYLAWCTFCVAAWVILPGEQVQGTTLRNGGRKTYKINAFSTLLLALAIASSVILRYGPESFTFIYDKWIGLLTASFILAFVQAVYVYAASFQSGKLLALEGNSGNFIYDWFIGRELNPSIGSFDIKSFNELRPGLIMWVLINPSMICEQATRRGGLSEVTDSMWLVFLFQAWYVADSLYNEPALFTTMDITSDGFGGFGFMLSVAVPFAPFAYSVQARYLAFHPVELGPVWVAAILAVNFLGYYIFRSANGEKNDFRNSKNSKNLRYMTTARGSKLLTSGWWGFSRHPNYFGDLIMAFAWSLPTKFDTPITYFYVIYFAVLLVHRQQRDDEACEKKYRADWEKYKKFVPWRIIRYIY